jgi:phosphoenolpyruvate carboxylase
MNAELHHTPFLGLNPRAVGLPDPLSVDIELVDALLGIVILEQGDKDMAEIARKLYAEGDKLDPQTLFDAFPELRDAQFMKRLLRAFTVLFQLLNTSEQKEIVRVNSEREARSGRAPPSESVAEAVQALRDRGVSAEEMRKLIGRLDICPTFTAHPTEARRRSVLGKLQEIAHAMIANAHWPEMSREPGDSVAARHSTEVLRTLTALWQTDELRASALTVIDEVTNALYFLEHSALHIVAWLHEDLRAALSRSYPGELFDIPAFVSYRSWVGGDRDGNPNVTARITWETLVRHKQTILGHYLQAVDALRHELTQSTALTAVSRQLLDSISKDAELVHLSEVELRRYQREPYALKLVYMHARLEATLDDVSALAEWPLAPTRSARSTKAYPDSDAPMRDLRTIEASLREHHGTRLAESGPLARLITQVMTFGFHFAALDVRQHSEEHERAVAQMLLAAGVLPPQRPYGSLPEIEKLELLQRELANPRPLLPPEVSLDDAREVLDVFSVFREAKRYLSREALTTYVISMTHGVSDVLEVLLLAKERGLFRWTLDGTVRRLETDIDVVPLFETIDDLHRCDELMRALFGDPVYRRHVEARGTYQEIMLGYSDSSKDGGFLAANASLYDTQSRLAAVCHEAGVRVRFFHGRGGTVGRGGGRANRAILSQPPRSFDGSIRFTEQGEVISFRYSLLPLGHRHMEQIVNAALLASSDRTAQAPPSEKWVGALQEMATRSLDVYRALVHDDPQFPEFYGQATPIQHISRLPIASRPASRGRQPAGLESLRAIPWVFAWVQSRYVVPGWYGLGSALKAYAEDDPEALATLSTMYREWLFFRMVINNAQLELLRAHLPTAAWYAKRVRPADLGRRIHARLEEEHALSRDWILRITDQSDLLGHAPVVRRTVELRNPTLTPLSKLQVALLDKLESESDQDGAVDASWQDAMLLSITGIAAAMQSTG